MAVTSEAEAGTPGPGLAARSSLHSDLSPLGPPESVTVLTFKVKEICESLRNFASRFIRIRDKLLHGGKI